MPSYRLKNPDATIFFDSVSKLKLTAATVDGKWVQEIAELKGPKSPKILEALKAGYIEECDKMSTSEKKQQTELHTKGPQEGVEYEAGEENDKTVGKGNKAMKLDDMSLEELQQYYSDEYEVSKKDITAFNKLTKDEALAELKELEKK